MTIKSKPQVELGHIAQNDLKRLRGTDQRRIIHAIDDLEVEPRPSNSQRLEDVNAEIEVRRLRLDPWRIVYLIIDDQPLVLAIRRRPPYDYMDIAALIESESR
jgi:mRNA-degrading endonuclease RelE of RelBE toxin-antitoxin system